MDHKDRKISSCKNFNGIYKAVVVDVNQKQYYMRVCIPSIHGKPPENLDSLTKSQLSKYPSTQICTTDFLDRDNGGLLSAIFSQENKVPILFPNKGDVVYVTFEGGDCRYPIFVGNLGKDTLNKSKSIEDSFWDELNNMFTEFVCGIVEQYRQEIIDNSLSGVGVNPTVENPSTIDKDTDISKEPDVSQERSIQSDIVKTAISYLDKNILFLLGSKDWTSGYLDCSGFVWQVFKDNNITIGQGTWHIWNNKLYRSTGDIDSLIKGNQIDATDLSNLKPADLIFYTTNDNLPGSNDSHVGIYIGNNNMIHCSNSIGKLDVSNIPEFEKLVSEVYSENGNIIKRYPKALRYFN